MAVFDRFLMTHFRKFTSSWSQQLTTYGTVGVLAFLYVTDWKVIVAKIPYYGGKFSEKND